MIFRIEYSESARQDLRDIYEYMTINLLASYIAAEQVRRIMENIRSLEQMPNRNPLYHSEPWRSKGYRFMLVNKYMVFYYTDNKLKIVYIVRILYGGRDISKCLTKD
ncbi:MAG: type II toxin-antitoxin system RelE/ParE family toxin [Lachnospiraceae bacterium]|nr:type II toxin-antitoxin system RelE/ParE family toxin [Lachnospiraceae bacterium]